MKGIKIAKIFGIDIELHWSWFLILFYFSWMLAAQVLPQLVPGQSTVAYWFFGVIIVLLLFVSVLIHELAHSKVAQLFKIRIQRITLMFFGGAAQMESVGKKAKEEFLIAIAGPLSSLGVAGIFWALAKFLKTDMALITVSLSYLFIINLLLAVFNLLPAYPMDGGRVFKTILWAISKNEMRSLKIATRVGQAFGILMAIAGIWKLGFWFVFIGGFLFLMAPGEYKQLRVKKILSQIKAKDVMQSVPEIWRSEDLSRETTCGPDDSLSSVLEKMANKNCSIVFVVENNEILGMITREIKAPQRGAFLLFFGLK